MPDIAVSAIVTDGLQVVLVLDPFKPEPLFWKLPGGRGEQDATTISEHDIANHNECLPTSFEEQTARWEVLEETGLKPRRFTPLIEESRRRRKKHKFILYLAPVDTFAGILEEGDEGERVGLFDINEIEEMMDFFPPHRKLLRKVRKVLGNN
jgi:8-oxo-dGTP pyrophosphatase MutT (NUDIX family)